jgi:glucose-6-phosphate 1-dehydrogenase
MATEHKTRKRAMSGTIPSMETTHEELKDNTIIIGKIEAGLYGALLLILYVKVFGASGDLAKKKVCGIHWPGRHHIH